MNVLLLHVYSSLKNTITEGGVIISIDPYGGYTAYFLYLPWQLAPILL